MNNLVDPAIDYIKNNSVEIAFCDYNMAKMNGIELAKIIKEYSPKADIVFVTGYGEYALDAINEVVPKGYILKPVSKSKIEAVINNLESFNSQKDIYIKTFGSFEVFYKNTPLNFKVKKPKNYLHTLSIGQVLPVREKNLLPFCMKIKKKRMLKDILPMHSVV